MNSSHRIPVSDESQVGTARRYILDLCKRCGVNDTRTGQAAIVATELGHNLVRHAGGGEILVREIAGDNQLQFEMLAIDKGPGMANVSESLRDGHSTMGTAGNGMGSIQRLSDRFEVYSQVGKGTVTWVYFGNSEPDKPYDIGGVSVALESEELCGDAWAVNQREGCLRVVMMDGLGHGAFAHEAAREAISVFSRNPNSPPNQLLELIHRALGKTRGAVGAVAELAPLSKEVVSAGVGNISMRLICGDKSKSLISDNGTLGASVRKVQEFRQSWSPDALLIMHSDGLSAQWSLENYPGLASRHPGVIAGVLYRDLRRPKDDATVVVVKYRP